MVTFLLKKQPINYEKLTAHSLASEGVWEASEEKWAFQTMTLLCLWAFFFNVGTAI